MIKKEELIKRGIEGELCFNFSRSGGPGGQNVNKVNSKVELRFNVKNSSILSEGEKEIILNKLSFRLTTESELVFFCQETRSQLKNKNIVLEKFYLTVLRALLPDKKRIKTKRTKASKEKRLNNKNKRAELKNSRKKPGNF